MTARETPSRLRVHPWGSSTRHGTGYAAKGIDKFGRKRPSRTFGRPDYPRIQMQDCETIVGPSSTESPEYPMLLCRSLNITCGSISVGPWMRSKYLGNKNKPISSIHDQGRILVGGRVLSRQALEQPFTRLKAQCVAASEKNHPQQHVVCFCVGTQPAEGSPVKWRKATAADEEPNQTQ
jgi:hypothetical protein